MAHAKQVTKLSIQDYDSIGDLSISITIKYEGRKPTVDEILDTIRPQLVTFGLKEEADDAPQREADRGDSAVQ